MIPYGRQDISEADISAVCDVLRSDFLTQGTKVPQFEKAVSQYAGSKHCFAMNSATSALHVACLALGLGKGDVLWTSPISFVASSNCALYCGAEVDFVDIDPLTYNLSVEALEAKLISAEAAGRLPKIVVPVHLCGQSCDMKIVKSLSKRFGFKIIEDASHAIGAKYSGLAVGNGEYSDITIFSFHPVKIITTAEGGMLLTNDDLLAQKVELFRSHGITRDPSLMSRVSDGPWYYEQVELGFNYRMTELQGALGLSQLDRLDEFVARRHEIADTYGRLLQTLPVQLPFQSPDSHSSYHLYVIRLKTESISATHRQIFDFLRENGVGVNLHYIPIYRQPYYSRYGFSSGDFPEAEKYYSEAISLPMFPGLSSADQQYVVDTLSKAVAL